MFLNCETSTKLIYSNALTMKVDGARCCTVIDLTVTFTWCAQVAHLALTLQNVLPHRLPLCLSFLLVRIPVTQSMWLCDVMFTCQDLCSAVIVEVSGLPRGKSAPILLSPRHVEGKKDTTLLNLMLRRTHWRRVRTRDSASSPRL